MKKKDDIPHINVDYFEGLTGDITDQDQESTDEIGRRLKSLRREKGLSLEELAEQTGFEARLLAKIEAAEVYPQLGTMIKLSKALDAAFGQIISGAGNRPWAITRMKDRKTVLRSTTGSGEQHIYAYKGLAPEVKGRSMEPLIVQLQESPEKEVSCHDGEEFIYVLRGTVLLELASDRYELEPGDSAYYLSNTPHWLAAKQNTATILAVLYSK